VPSQVQGVSQRCEMPYVDRLPEHLVPARRPAWKRGGSVSQLGDGGPTRPAMEPRSVAMSQTPASPRPKAAIRESEAEERSASTLRSMSASPETNPRKPSYSGSAPE